jgi:hypothetical protein
MPLSKGTKRKLRKLVGLIRPQDKTDLLAEEVREDVAEIAARLNGIPDYVSTIATLRDSLTALSESVIAVSATGATQGDLASLGDSYKKQFTTLETKVEVLAATIRAESTTSLLETKTELEEGIEQLRKELQKVRIELLGKVGGGSMNRQIFVGGNDPLIKYTDINFKAGSNVTLTYANNNTTQKAEITIAATGGGGGTTRSINSISGDTTAGDTSGTDYVYLCSGTLTLTLPTAVANGNLYTIKNVGVGTVTIATTSLQTIDGDTTVIMPIRYTAVDVISDTANWNIT